MGTVLNVRMENKTPPHNKFYTVLIVWERDTDAKATVPTKWTVVSQWGAIGTKSAQHGSKVFNSLSGAKQEAQSIMRKRRAHGYTTVHGPDLDRMSPAELQALKLFDVTGADPREAGKAEPKDDELGFKLKATNKPGKEAKKMLNIAEKRKEEAEW